MYHSHKKVPHCHAHLATWPAPFVDMFSWQTMCWHRWISFGMGIILLLFLASAFSVACECVSQTRTNVNKCWPLIGILWLITGPKIQKKNRNAKTRSQRTKCPESQRTCKCVVSATIGSYYNAIYTWLGSRDGGPKMRGYDRSKFVNVS